MRQSQAEVARTRAGLLQAALAMFSSHGIRASSLESIAVQAGVTRGAVYWHFEDKHALLRELVHDVPWPLDIGCDLARYNASAEPIQLALDSLWETMQRCMADVCWWPRVRLLLRATLELPEDIRQTLAQAMGVAVHRLTLAVDIGARCGELRAGLKPHHVAQCLHAAGLALLTEQAGQALTARVQPSPLGLKLLVQGACVPAWARVGKAHQLA